jgi:hypothetical protein
MEIFSPRRFISISRCVVTFRVVLSDVIAIDINFQFLFLRRKDSKDSRFEIQDAGFKMQDTEIPGRVKFEVQGFNTVNVTVKNEAAAIRHASKTNVFFSRTATGR